MNPSGTSAGGTSLRVRTIKVSESHWYVVGDISQQEVEEIEWRDGAGVGCVCVWGGSRHNWGRRKIASIMSPPLLQT